MSTSHAINGIIDEDGGDIFTPAGRVDDFGHANGGQIAIALIGKDHQIRSNAFNTGGHRRCTSMGGLLKIKSKIIIHHNGTAHRCDTNGFAANTEFIDNFGHQSVGNSVGAARTIMGNRIGQGLWFLKCFSHWCSPILSQFVEWLTG